MNTVCHIEIDVTDMDRAEAFYKALFGWTFREFMPSMRVFGAGDQHIGGLTLREKVEVGRSPSVWFQVASIEETLEKVRANGGKALSEKSEVPSVGWSADFADPDGNYIGIVEYA